MFMGFQRTIKYVEILLANKVQFRRTKKHLEVMFIDTAGKTNHQN